MKPSDARDEMTFMLHATASRKWAVSVARVLFEVIMQLEADGCSTLPAGGGFILASNHVSNWDVVALQLALPRPIFFMGKAELFRLAPVGAILRNFGAFPVYRGEQDGWALEHAHRVLDAGQVLGMFPEGHRSGGRGLGPARIGSAKLAIEAKCSIVPVTITGTHQLLRSQRRARVRVSCLAPIMPMPGESAEALTERLMQTIARDLPEGMRGVYSHIKLPASAGADLD